MRILGIDLGGSHTGLALSDPLGVICSPLDTLHERNETRLIQRIVEVSREREVALIVLGLPRPLSGGTNRQLETVLSFKTRLEQALSIPVHTWDERFTSKLAAEIGSTRTGRDSVAASYMLQNYLDSRPDAVHDKGTHEQQTG